MIDDLHDDNVDMYIVHYHLYLLGEYEQQNLDNEIYDELLYVQIDLVLVLLQDDDDELVEFDEQE